MEEAALLASPQAPIVVLPADGPQKLPEAIAPGLDTLGFMLPTTPLHHLILAPYRPSGGDDQRAIFRTSRN